MVAFSKNFTARDEWSVSMTFLHQMSWHINVRSQPTSVCISRRVSLNRTTLFHHTHRPVWWSTGPHIRTIRSLPQDSNGISTSSSTTLGVCCRQQPPPPLSRRQPPAAYSLSGETFFSAKRPQLLQQHRPPLVANIQQQQRLHNNPDPETNTRLVAAPA